MLKTKISALKGICVLVLLLMLGSYDLLAQNRKVTLTVKNETIGNVLKSIEDETGYMFIYRDGAVDKSRRVSISVEEVDVLDVLKVIFQGTDTEASIINNNISLVKKPASPSVVSVPATVQSLKTVKGTVMDTDGQSVIGAVVQVDGTQNGVVTDLDGNYTLEKVADGASIRFSCMGYVDLVKTYKGERQMNAILYEDSETLEEAVAVAFS